MQKVGWVYKRCSDAINFRLRSLAGGRFASYCRPTTIIFLLTERCNARCVHCDIWKNTGPEDTPAVDQLKTCLHELRHWLGPVQVTLTGGEALIKPYAIDLVQYSSSLGLFVEVLTNGYWSDQAKLERLALANPWRITISLDGIGAAHDKIRGRDDFFARTRASIATLSKVRQEHRLDLQILLKTVIMEHNLDDLCSIARFAGANGLDVLYQPIEQNYNTADDPNWFFTSANWPRDRRKVRAALGGLADLKRRGLPIANSYDSLRIMSDYFDQPEQLRIAVQSHVSPARASICSAVTSIQVQANGDVTTCSRRPPVGNIREATIRQIWGNRPAYWHAGCCRA